MGKLKRLAALLLAALVMLCTLTGCEGSVAEPTDPLGELFVQMILEGTGLGNDTDIEKALEKMLKKIDIQTGEIAWEDASYECSSEEGYTRYNVVYEGRLFTSEEEVRKVCAIILKDINDHAVRKVSASYRVGKGGVYLAVGYVYPPWNLENGSERL